MKKLNIEKFERFIEKNKNVIDFLIPEIDDDYPEKSVAALFNARDRGSNIIGISIYNPVLHNFSSNNVIVGDCEYDGEHHYIHEGSFYSGFDYEIGILKSDGSLDCGDYFERSTGWVEINETIFLETQSYLSDSFRKELASLYEDDRIINKTEIVKNFYLDLKKVNAMCEKKKCHSFIPPDKLTNNSIKRILGIFQNAHTIYCVNKNAKSFLFTDEKFNEASKVNCSFQRGFYMMISNNTYSFSGSFQLATFLADSSSGSNFNADCDSVILDFNNFIFIYDGSTDGSKCLDMCDEEIAALYSHRLILPETRKSSHVQKLKKEIKKDIEKEPIKEISENPIVLPEVVIPKGVTPRKKYPF